MKNIFKIIIMSMFLVLIVGCSKTNSYTVTFDSNGGSNVDEIVITEEEQLKLPKEPTKEGYKFNGWLLNGKLFNESTIIDKDITLKADWISNETKTYKVLFIYNNNTKDLEINVEENTKVSKPSNPTKEGYKFLGWYLDNNKYDFDKELNSDIILFAKWEEQNQNNNSNSNTTNNANSSSTNNNNNSNNNTDKEVRTEDAKLSYSCYDSSYKLNGDKCVKSISVDSTKEYYCESGYNLSGTTCSKQISNTDTKSASVSYSCISPYVLNGSKCTYNLSSDALQRYYCTSGTLSGSSCKTQVKYPLVASVRQWCANNGLSGSGSCPRSGCSAVGGIFDSTEHSNNSSSLYWCYKWNESSTAAKLEYYCPNGYSLNGSKCEKYYEVDAVPSYSCPTGYTQNGSQCIKTTYSTDKVSAKYKYTCPSGYTLSNSTCKKEFSVDANKEYTCPKNYTLKGTTCYSN